jgi:hypothetical protein
MLPFIRPAERRMKMEVKELLRNLDLGNSVAEFDDALDRYFIETEAFRALALAGC